MSLTVDDTTVSVYFLSDVFHRPKLYLYVMLLNIYFHNDIPHIYSRTSQTQCNNAKNVYWKLYSLISCAAAAARPLDM